MSIVSEEEMEGRYLYCIAEGGKQTSLGKIGIEGSEVYSVPYKDLCAVVHNCPAEPYESEDSEKVGNWVVAHEKVVEVAWGKFGTVLPLGFDTIIKGEESIGPEENLKNWLKRDYKELKKKMEQVKGKTEYGVQIFWDAKIIAHKIAQTNEEVKKLEEEVKSKPKGTAYMYRQRLEKAVKREMEILAEAYFRDFYYRIKKHADDLRVERTKRINKDQQMLVNLSCLVSQCKSARLGEELEKIGEVDGFSVRFTGPWPPYSFT